MARISATRRRFLLCSSAALAGLGAGAWQVWNSTARKPREWQAFNRSSTALGSNVTMTVLHRGKAEAESALDAAFVELELIEDVMSIYRPDSQVCRLNRDGCLSNPHPHLVKVLEHASLVAAQTDGAFDVTVQPLWTLFREAQRRGNLPDEDSIRQAREAVDWRRVQIESDRIQLTGKGTAITLNGIAQGFAADAAMATLRRHGVEHALIDTGEMGALGTKPTGEGWKLGIQHPREPDAFVSMARLKDRCLATSGDYQTRFSDGFAHHHLFDPHTGLSPTELSSVSVAAPSAMAADALSTALFVLGFERGLELIQRTPGTDALLVQKNGRVLATDGFPTEA